MGKTSIQWTDMTWNPVRGCTRKSPGCINCYAEVMAARFSKPGQWGHGFAEMRGGDHRWTGKVELVDSMLTLPLRWRKPRKIFVNSTSDLFHEALTGHAIDKVFAVMAMCPQHTFQILTKRPELMVRYFQDRRRGDPWGEAADAVADILGMQDHPIVLEPKHIPLPNVWLGTSIEDQERANERIPLLKATPAAVRFLSVEPLLEEVELGDLTGIHQVIVGGESGPGAREFYAGWARKIVKRCQGQGVAVFVKQMGSHVRDRNDAGFEGGDGSNVTEWPDMNFDRIEHDPDGYSAEYQGAPVRLHLAAKKGDDMEEWPEDLRVREMPA